LYQEFVEGNWVVNKNPDVSFSALGADHALEQINRSMKVSGGLVGITLNPNARNKFFLIAPELSRLADEAKEMAGTIASDDISIHHHTLTVSVTSREEKNIEQLLITMENFTNPFSQEGDQLFNLVTKVVMPDQVKKDLMEQTEETKASNVENSGEEDKDCWYYTNSGATRRSEPFCTYAARV
jgi:hypothetical protein